MRYGIRSKGYDTEYEALFIKSKICSTGIIPLEQIRIYKDVKVWRWIISPFPTFNNAKQTLDEINKRFITNGFVIEI